MSAVVGNTSLYLLVDMRTHRVRVVPLFCVHRRGVGMVTERQHEHKRAKFYGISPALNTPLLLQRNFSQSTAGYQAGQTNLASAHVFRTASAIASSGRSQSSTVVKTSMIELFMSIPPLIDQVSGSPYGDEHHEGRQWVAVDEKDT